MGELLQDFKTGGGLKTAVRRFVQIALGAVLGAGGLAFTAGEMGPAILDTPWTDPSPKMPYTPEYGPEWAKWAALIALGGAAINAIYYPFATGRRIRQGELDEISDMLNIGTAVKAAVRRGVNMISGIPERRQRDDGEISLAELFHELEEQKPEISSTLATTIEKIIDEKPPKRTP